MNPNDIYIVAAKRTAQGALLGSLSSLSAPHLAAVTHRACLEQAGLSSSDIDEVLTGCVLQANQGQAPARQGVIHAGLPISVGATTVNRMCGSGMMATMLGCDRIKAGSANVVIVGGMESMSKAPYVLEKARLGYRMGHSEIKDSMFVDGLEDAYETGKLMGCFADATALRYGLTREAQDDYAKLSMTRALEAQRNGSFAAEIVPVVIKDKARGDVVVNTDESPDETKVAKLSKLKAVFNPSDSGTVTAGNSSSIADGAASLILMTGAECDRRGIKPLARIVAYTSHSQEPAWFTTAPAAAVHKLLALAGWSLGDVDLFEVNEAFAAVALACINELGLSVDRVNVHGGACAMGHPIGASGARIIVTLIYALMRHDKTRGVATLCIGGGEATAIAIERVV